MKTEILKIRFSFTEVLGDKNEFLGDKKIDRRWEEKFSN
jgi:hypothetical protein